MKAEVTTFAALLHGDVEFVIPQFQRTYAWKREEQWSPLWDDIINTANAVAAAGSCDEVPPHFMGPLVIQERSERADGRPPGFIVVDGQQRMTTMLVLLKAGGDAAAELGMLDLAEKFLARIWNEIDSGVKTPKVRHANGRDRSALLEVLHGLTDTDADSNIADCYAFFNDAVVKYVKEAEDRGARCQNLLHTLEKKMETAALLLNPDEQPNIVFETLNARGEPLKPSELVKNTVMFEGGVVEDEVRASTLWHLGFEDPYWYDEKDGCNTLDRFLSDWLTARLERRIVPSRVAPEFCAYLQSMKAAGHDVQYVTDRLNLSAKIYRDVESHQFAHTKPSSERLLQMGIYAIMPIMLWLWDPDNSVDRRERQATLRTIESYVIRRILANLNVGATLMNTLVAVFPQLRTATDGSLRHSNLVRDFLNNLALDSTRWPEDEEIKNRLKTMPHGMSAARRDVVLTALENRLRRDCGKTPLDFKPHTALLMPSSEASWANGFPLTGPATKSRLQRRQDRVGSLGNLTLTRGTMSKKQQELSWPEKRELLERHKDLEMTRHLLEKSDAEWTEDAIEDRNVVMADLAIRTWPHHIK